MKFSKATIKHHSKKLSNNSIIIRSFFGVIAHDDFYSEKINGALGFFEEPTNRKIFNDIGIKDTTPLKNVIQNEMSSAFKKSQTEHLDEHCTLIIVKNDVSESHSLYISDVSELCDGLTNVTDAIMIVVVHFLPYQAVEQYAECARSNYNISFSNRYSFKGHCFVATMSLRHGEKPSYFSNGVLEKHDREMIDIRDKLKNKFELIETTVAPDGSYRSSPSYIPVGFKLYFNELSRINIIKLINVADRFNINITSSLKSLGMTKE